jgi:hypothetical protein
MRNRDRPLTPSDRRFLRLLPITLLFQKVRGHPARLFNEQPQLHRLVRARLVTVAYDASANAATLNRSTKADEAIASIFVLPPEDVLPDRRR